MNNLSEKQKEHVRAVMDHLMSPPTGYIRGGYGK